MTGELPVSSLLTAQLAWSRLDLGPMDELTADIKKRGVRRPLLIAPDYLMLDGARRLVAANKAGLKFVPVIICYTWERFAEHYQPLADDAYPMTWIEIDNLIANVLRPLYKEFRYRSANATRDERRAGGLPPLSQSKRETHYSHFVGALSNLFDTEPVHIKMLTDQMRRLTRTSKDNAPLGAALQAAIQGIEPENRRSLNYVRSLKTALDRYARGAEGIEATAELLTEQVRAMGSSGGRFKFTRRRRDTIDPTAPVVGIGVLKNFSGLLGDLGDQADELRNFKPHTVHQIQETVRAYDTAVRVSAQLYRLRRRLEAVLPDDIPGVEDKEPIDG